jgi:pimeloyl-ACP methyl ester carboxylesterase/DNA-binding CsgD family transcriptional regulator
LKKSDVTAVSLVSKIYEKTLKPDLYQGLTAQDDNDLAGFDITETELNTSTAGTLCPKVLAEIRPHLEQAIALTETQRANVEIPPTPSDISFFDLPLPVCVLSEQLLLQQVNLPAQGMVKSGVTLPSKASHALNIEQSLKNDILAAASIAMSTNTTRTVGFSTAPGVIRTVLVAPQNPFNNSTAPQAAILFLNHESRINELAIALVDTHGLTQSEAEVAAYLAQGFAPEEIANKKNISISTVRTQIKKVFRKTNTTRQAQLVSLVLNGPAVWMNILSYGAQSGQHPAATKVPGDIFVLADGRNMSYGDFGPKDGVPVIFFHHLFGSRNDKPDDESLLARLGIRLIIPERPGVGQSCPKQEMNLIAAAGDVLQLVDKLQIDRFHVVGLSAGAPFATAFATITSDRAIKLGIITAQMPVEELPEGTKVGTIHRFLTSVACYLPSLALKQLEHNYSKLLSNPEQMLSKYKHKTNSADKRLHQDPRINRIRLTNIQDAATRNPSIYARDLTAGFRPWGCKLSELKIPVILWHGKQDEVFSYEHALTMANIIPNCKTVFNDNWGHFFPLQEWESIYKTLIE